MKVVWGGLARVTEQARHNIVGNAIGLSFYSKKEREKERKLFFSLQLIEYIQGILEKLAIDGCIN